MEGWIKIYRKVKEHWIWKSGKFQWWVDILISVNHEPNKVFIRGKLIDCKRGQSVRSLDSWAKDWMVTKKTVKDFFDLLEKDSMLETENLQITTRITVCNYDIYQDSVNAEETQKVLDRKRSVNGHYPQTRMNKNEKNITSPTNVVDVSKPSDFDASVNPEINDNIPYKKIMDYWNENTKLPKITLMTDTRKKYIRARWKEHGRDSVRLVMEKTFKSGFMNGKNPSAWSASFDWIFLPTNFVKVLEGNFDDKNVENNHDISKIVEMVKSGNYGN